MSVAQILSQTPASLDQGVAATTVAVPADRSSTLGPTSFQNQALTGVLSITGGDATGVGISATNGGLFLTAAGANQPVSLIHDATGVVQILPDISPPPAGAGAALSFINRGGNNVTWDHLATGTSGGGLSADNYALWAYPSATTGFGKPYWQMPSPQTTGSTGVIQLNPSFLDPTRTGEVVGTGAPQQIACNSIRAGSVIQLIPVAGPAFPAAVPVVGAIVPAGLDPPYAAGNITVTLVVGITYRYTIYG